MVIYPAVRRERQLINAELQVMPASFAPQGFQQFSAVLYRCFFGYDPSNQRTIFPAFISTLNMKW